MRVVTWIPSEDDSALDLGPLRARDCVVLQDGGAGSKALQATAAAIAKGGYSAQQNAELAQRSSGGVHVHLLAVAKYRRTSMEFFRLPSQDDPAGLGRPRGRVAVPSRRVQPLGYLRARGSPARRRWRPHRHARRQVHEGYLRSAGIDHCGTIEVRVPLRFDVALRLLWRLTQ